MRYSKKEVELIRSVPKRRKQRRLFAWLVFAFVGVLWLFADIFEIGRYFQFQSAIPLAFGVAVVYLIHIYFGNGYQHRAEDLLIKLGNNSPDIVEGFAAEMSARNAQDSEPNRGKDTP